MNRRSERETVFIMLFEVGFKKDEDANEFFSASLAEKNIEKSDYLEKVFMGVSEKEKEIDDIISENAKGWKLSRISRVAVCIMRISIFEMMTLSSEIPFAVSINEAVELAKKYDDDSAPKFVNGILNSVAQKLGLK